jgi:hypothetical protein
LTVRGHARRQLVLKRSSFQEGLAEVGFGIAFLLNITLRFALLFYVGIALSAAEQTNHWAFQPLVAPAVPPSAYASPIDAFVSIALEKKGARIAPEAERRVLIRRLSFDLRGLPPSAEEVAAFLEDKSGNAYERLVERFLDSPQYGERWGRHWLDIVGYADSNGYFSADSDRPLAWKYRDYVVRSLNANKPLDRFIQEQLAGDELVGYVANGDVTPEMLDPLIATHFWRNAPDGTGESDGNPLEVKVDKYAVLESNVQIFGAAFLGLTLQCSRCHDHKFEPVKQEDYYALQAIMRPAFDIDHWLKPNERVIEVGLRAEREAHHKKSAEIERDLKMLRESLEGLTAPFRKQAVEANLASLDESLRKSIQKALDTKEKDRSVEMKSLLKTNAAFVEVSEDALGTKFPPFAAAAKSIQEAITRRAADRPAPLEKIAATFEPTNTPPTHHLLVRGNHANEGNEVVAAVPTVFRAHHDTKDEGFTCACVTSGRRLALARWVTAGDNPIVPRVLANRIWHYHFGQGLVSTIDNLGRSGARPVAPELLDWLAAELVRSGWDLKHIHRLIVTSAAWKQALNPAEEGELALGRVRSERLDAESLRDAMLAVSGELDLRVGGAYVGTTTDKQGQVVLEEKKPGAVRRSIYLQQRRTSPVDFLATFDGPAHNPVCVQRVSSTVALQSLSLLNSEFVHLRARAFAKRLLGSCAGDPSTMADKAFELAYSRPASNPELTAAREFLGTQSAIYKDEPDAQVRVWTDFCQMLLASNTFLYVD